MDAIRIKIRDGQVANRPLIGVGVNAGARIIASGGSPPTPALMPRRAAVTAQRSHRF
ncbi:MAG TPA: hypothetical protein VHI10_09625 [Mycobacterium sp.]|nr:hypothetical protein [Mycobacterium sp.]